MKRLLFLITVILLLTTVAGCRSRPVENNFVEGQLLSIEKSKVPVKITVIGCEAFEGMTDVVYASTINGDGIISEVSRCTEFAGDHFGGSYDIRAVNSRNARYYITPTETQDEPIVLGMNYYDVLLEAEFQTADHVEIQCNSDITVKGLVGEFELTVLAADGEKWSLGSKINRISGVADRSTDIVLTCSDGGYILTSTAHIHGIDIIGSETVNNEYIETTASSEETANRYVFSYMDNRYFIAAEQTP